MKTAVGCLFYVALTAALAFAVERVTGPQVAATWRPWLSIVAAALLTIGVANLVQLLKGYGQGDASREALLARARTGEPPAGGGPMLVTGRARPDGPLLHAPLSGRPCVAYEYRLFEERGSRRERLQTIVSWWGYGCQPFVVDTGTRAVRVAAIPQLRATRVPDDPGVADRVRQFVAVTSFEEVAGILGMASTMPTMLRDAVHVQGSGVRRDWRRADVDVADPASLTPEEAVLPADTEVSVAGYWSPEQNAIVPEPGGLGGSPVTATTGRAKRLLVGDSIAPHSVGSVLVAGLVCLAIGGGLVWAASAGYFAP
jgi:hypothetical protein